MTHRDIRFSRAPIAVCALAVCSAAMAQSIAFSIPAGDMESAINAYVQQSGSQLIFKVDDLRGLRTRGVSGTLSNEEALSRLLQGTPLRVRRDGANAGAIYRVAEPERRTADDTAVGLETVTVLVQKRPESAQQVPISLTTLSSRTLESQRVSNLQDVSRLTPGLLVSSFSPSNPTLAIRGATNTFNQIGVSKPVAVVIDDVFVPRNSAASFELFDLQDISVLRGPQGTLFGRNVTGGAIVINTRKPSLVKTDLAAEATVGNLGAKGFNGLVSTPLGEEAAVKLTTSLKRRDGFGRDRLTGREEDNLDSQNLRGQARLALGADAEALLSLDYSHDSSGGRTLSSVTLGDDGDRRTSELGVDQSFGRQIWGASAKIDWSLGGGELTSITAYRKSRATDEYSGVGANYSLLTAGSQSLTRDADQLGTLSQELRYATPKWRTGDFVVGLYYSNDDGARQLGVRGLAAKTGKLASSTLADQRVRTESYSVFADGNLHLTSSLDAVAGARYTHDTKSASLVRTDLVKPANSFAADGVEASWSEVTPRAALNWRPSENATLFVGVSQGFTSGGFNADATSAAVFTTPFDPETVTNYELGAKSQWLENRLRVNLSVFRMKYKNKQEFVNNTQTGVLSIVNASRATIDGGELEIAYRPVKWLNLGLGYGRLDASYDQFAVGTINYTGNPLGSAPRNKLSASADFNVEAGGAGRVFGAASYARLSDYNTGAANDPNLMVPGYSLVNLSLGWESAQRHWRVTAWVKNAADTEYILTRSTQVVRAEYLGEPRTFGLSLGVRF